MIRLNEPNYPKKATNKIFWPELTPFDGIDDLVQFLQKQGSIFLLKGRWTAHHDALFTQLFEQLTGGQGFAHVLFGEGPALVSQDQSLFVEAAGRQGNIASSFLSE